MASTDRLRSHRFAGSGLFVSVLLTFSILLSACGGSTSAPASTGSTSGKAGTIKAPTTLVSAGTLTVGSDTTYPPQEFIDTASGKATGFDVDLINEVASRLGLKPDVVTTKFDTIIDSLSNKRFDVVISAITINDERKKKVDFVPYFNAGESLLVKKGNPEKLKTVADLCGKAVGVQTGTVEQTDLNTAQDACKKASKPSITVTSLQDQTAVVQLLATGRVVATYQDSPVTDYYLKLNSGQLEVGGSVVNAAQEGIAVAKSNPDMLKAVQGAISQMKTDGTYQKLIDKWGLKSGAI